MLHLDHKYFVPFPEFFLDRNYDSEVYLGIDFTYQNAPTSVNIIFTRSDNLEEIKEAAGNDYEETKDMNLPGDVKLAIVKAYDKLNNTKPSEPKFKLEFQRGNEGYHFSEENTTLTIFVDSNRLPNPEKAFFYTADI